MYTTISVPHWPSHRVLNIDPADDGNINNRDTTADEYDSDGAKELFYGAVSKEIQCYDDVFMSNGERPIVEAFMQLGDEATAEVSHSTAS